MKSHRSKVGGLLALITALFLGILEKEARSLDSATGIVDATTLRGSDACAKIAAAIGTMASGGIVDARKFGGIQACSMNPLTGVTKPVLLMLGSVRIQAKTPWLVADNHHFRLLGSGPAFSTLEYVGRNKSPYVLGIIAQNPQKSDITGVAVEGLSVIGGNGNATDGLYLQGIHRSQFRDLSFWGVTGAAIHTRFAVTDTFSNCHASAQEMRNFGLFSGRSVPAQLFRFGSYNAQVPSQTTNGTVSDAIAEGLMGTGWWLESAASMTFTSGTSEENLNGLQIDTPSANNTLIGSDFESNRGGWDVTDNGTSTHLVNVIAVSANPPIILGPTSKFMVVDGGNIRYGVRASSLAQSASVINGPVLQGSR